MNKRIAFSGTPEQALRMLYDLPHILAGTIPDKFGIVKGIQLRAANALLSQIQLAFIEKSRGRVGSDGIKWPPLKPETIAGRRITPAEWRTAKLQGTPTKNDYERGLLTPEQNTAWKKKFAQVLALARMDLPEKEAKAKAGRVAWSFVLHEYNAKTRIAFFGYRQVDILRDTVKLFRSFTPGIADKGASPAPESQILIIKPGTIVVGSSEKPWHHKGIPGRLPARSLWPLNDEIPEAWWVHINDAITTGIMEVAQLLLQSVRAA